MTFLQFWLIGTVITTTCLSLVSLASANDNNDWSTIRGFIFFLFIAVFSFLLWPIAIGIMLADQYMVLDKMKEKTKE